MTKTTKLIIVPFFAVYKYIVGVYTADILLAGTDANVYMTIYGERGDTGKRKLLKSLTNDNNKFEQGSVSVSINLYHLNFQVGWLVGWLVGCVLRPIDSEVIYRRHPNLLSLAKDVKLSKYTVSTGNRTPGRRVAVHYTTAAPRKLHKFSDFDVPY